VCEGLCRARNGPGVWCATYSKTGHGGAWDCYELLRNQTEATVFRFVKERKFDAGAFKIVKEPKPHLRFRLEVGRELAGATVKAVPFRLVVKACREVAGLF
jgi:hypothetical protein